MSDQNQEEVLDLEAPDEEIALDFEKVRPKSGHKIDKTRRKELMAKRFVFNEYTTKSNIRFNVIIPIYSKMLFRRASRDLSAQKSK